MSPAPRMQTPATAAHPRPPSNHERQELDDDSDDGDDHESIYDETDPRYLEKEEMIKQILKEDDLYAVLGAPREAPISELRKYYLSRARILHPDRQPFHPLSTGAFQRLGFAFEVLRSPFARRSYDRAAQAPPRPAKSTSYSASGSSLSDGIDNGPITQFINGETTFLSAISSLLLDISSSLTLASSSPDLSSRYPHLLPPTTVALISSTLNRIHSLLLTSRFTGLVLLGELDRIMRVQRELNSLGYLDVLGRARESLHLIKVLVAVPVRVDRALKRREERAERARRAGEAASGAPPPSPVEVEKVAPLQPRGRLVWRVLEWVAGPEEEAEKNIPHEKEGVKVA